MSVGKTSLNLVLDELSSKNPRIFSTYFRFHFFQVFVHPFLAGLCLPTASHSVTFSTQLWLKTLSNSEDLCTMSLNVLQMNDLLQYLKNLATQWSHLESFQNSLCLDCTSYQTRITSIGPGSSIFYSSLVTPVYSQD